MMLGMKRSRLPSILIAATMVLGACGEDSPGADAAGGDNETTGADPALDAFCRAHLDAEAASVAAMAGGDDTAVGPAFEALVAAAPDDLSATVGTVVELAAAGDEESPEFEAAYGELLGFVAANCGYPELTVTAKEFEFGGVPETLAAGPTTVTLENSGEQFHHIVLMRINDGVTEPIEDLLELPDDEVFAKITPLGEAFAAPGSTGTGVFDFQPGRHVAICFIPEGAMPENMAAIESGDHHGAPHFTYGMVQEFEVS